MVPHPLLRPFLPAAPFTRGDRWIVMLLWGTGVALGWSQGEASALLPFTRLDLGVTEGGMGLVLAVARLAAFGAIVFGAAADRIGRRRPLLVALGLLIISTGLSAAATSPVTYTLAQSGARIGGAAVSALAVVAMAEGVSPAIRAYAISFFGAAASLGAGMAVMTLPLAEVTGLGWRLPHALPLAAIVLVPFLWGRLPESPLTVAAHDRLPWGDLLRGERRRRFLIVGMAGMLGSAFSSVGLAFTTERLIGDLGFSSGAAVLVAVGGGTLGAVGFFVGGRLADGWGRRPTSVLALSLALVGGLALYQVTSLWMAAAAAAVSSFGSFAYIPSGGAHRAELFPTSLRAAAGTAAGYLATVGSAFGLLTGTIMIDSFGLAATMTTLGIGVVAAAALTTALPETLGQSLDRV